MLTAFSLSEQMYARSEIEEVPPTYCTVFHHMVKSAGSTIKSILRRASVVDGVAKPGEQSYTIISTEIMIRSTCAHFFVGTEPDVASTLRCTNDDVSHGSAKFMGGTIWL